MSNEAILGVIAAIAVVFQAQAGAKLAPVIRFPAAMSFESVCTGVDLNIGCVPAELAPPQPADR